MSKLDLDVVARAIGMKPSEIIAAEPGDAGLEVGLFDGTTLIVDDDGQVIGSGRWDTVPVPVDDEPVEVVEEPVDDVDESAPEAAKGRGRKSAAADEDA